MTEISPWAFLFVSVLATTLPRALGALAAGRVDLNSRVFEFVTAIAYAILGGDLRFVCYCCLQGRLRERLLLIDIGCRECGTRCLLYNAPKVSVRFVAGAAMFWAIQFWRLDGLS